MPYVGRNQHGKIVAVGASESADLAEWVEPNAPDLRGFLAQLAPAEDDLSRSDQALIRVVEDIVNTLIEKNVIRFTDLPEAAQHKLLERRSMRRAKGSLKLLGEETLTDLKL
jgi:hypothetical protein